MSALTFHRRRAVLTSLARNKERAHKWVTEKYHSQLLASKSELFGETFFKAVQQDAKSVDLSVIQYLQNKSKRSKPPFHGGSATSPRLQASSSFAEPQRAATTSSRGARGKIQLNMSKAHISTIELKPLSLTNVHPIIKGMLPPPA